MTDQELFEHPWGQVVNEFNHGGVNYTQYLWCRWVGDDGWSPQVMAITANQETGQTAFDVLNAKTVEDTYKHAAYAWSRQREMICSRDK